MIEIRNGCKFLYKNQTVPENYWAHEDAKTSGIIRTVFAAPIDIIPKIGDYINEDNYQWVERTEYKIVPNLEPQFPDEDEFTFRR